MIKEADHQGGRVIHPTAFPAFLKIYRNLHVATKPMRIFVCESEINYYYYYHYCSSRVVLSSSGQSNLRYC